MPNFSSMSSSPTNVITTLEIIQGKLLADSMLEDLLSNLHEVERTSVEVQAILHLIMETPAIYKMMSAFFRKIKASDTYLARCSMFQKRMLLFNIVQCLLSGENLELHFTSERLTPLETILLRLEEVAVACQKDIDEAELRTMYFQTIKQAVFIFLKNNKPIEASKILVVNRHLIAEEYGEVLQELINHCSESKDILDELEEMPEHDYAHYCAAMVNFVEGVNASLEGSVLKKLSRNLVSARSNNPVNEFHRDIRDEPMERSIRDHSPSRGKSPKSSLLIESDEEKISETEIQNEEGTKEQPAANSSSHSDLDPSHDAAEKDVLDSISPKISLSYRLKKQNHKSGIIIPCKYIVEHCRKVNDDSEDENGEGFFNFPNKTKRNSSTPIKNSTSGKNGFRNGHRNYLLGERFEDLNVPLQNSDGRTYSRRKKFSFSIELDSYIVAGCRHFGVGYWSQIRDAFPFPQNCTNIKIKDRFRTLIKLNYIAILDDGDFNVMNSTLKSMLPAAIEKMKKKKETTLSTMKEDRKIPKRPKDHNPAKSAISEEAKNVPGPSHAKEKDSRLFDLMSMSSGDLEESPIASTPKFTPTEDAYLLCGARHLGLRWSILKEYFDFQPHITSSHMQERWDELISQGKIEADDDGSEIYCHDVSLENRCFNVTNKLKRKIQKQRKSFADAKEHEENANSESSAVSSIIPPSKKFAERRSRRKIQESFASDNGLDDAIEMDEDHSNFRVPERGLSPKFHNTSVDAGTQTKKQRVALRRQSPSLLDCESSSSGSGPGKQNHNGSKFEAGTPIRPSALNYFKRARQGKKRKIERSNSLVSELRERRQRELSRKHRKKAPVKKTSWSAAETAKLKDGLKKFGPGKWSRILDYGYEVLKDRSSVMLKDRYRTLLKQGVITDKMLKDWETERASCNSP